MARKPKILLAIGLLLLAGSFVTIFTERYLFFRNPPSFVYSTLTDFRSVSPQYFSNSDAQDEVSTRDTLCGGCYHAVAKPDENIRCGLLIFQLKEKGLSLLDAALQVSSDKEYEEACARCRPGACSKEETIYWKYDTKQKVPPILSSNVPRLQSVSSTQRIPPNAMQDLEDFFALPNHAVPPARYLFEYNPSIVILPTNYFDKTKFSPEGQPMYLSSMRLSTQQSCFHPSETKAMYGGNWDHKPPVEDFLALALLKADRSVIQDVVVDIKASGIFQHFAEDFRLFVFQDQVYVASFDLILPLWIGHSPKSSSIEQQTVLSNVFPSDLKVAIRSFPSCPVCLNRPNKRCGKNLNYFSTDVGQVWVELWPTGPHVVQKVDLTQPCSESRKATEKSELEVYSDASFRPPLPSFYTMEEVMFPNMDPSETLLTRGRGGACCITVEDPRTGNTLLVGTYHTKIPKFSKRSGKRVPLWRQPNCSATKLATNQYLSRWYAFQSTPPFPVVAKSGLFCLGFPGQKEDPLIQSTLWKKMFFGGDGLVETLEEGSLILDCPRIHFVSGMAEKASDPSRVIVAYGVNDCVSRLIEVQKEAIVQSLFPPKG